MLELDGSMGEGGGQILRSALTLSAITGKPFRLRKIRAHRAKPGLQPQHLMCVLAMAKICQAEVNGASLHSVDLTFRPGSVRPGTYEFRIGTAGATGLLLQAIYLPLALQREASTLTLIGGTHVSASPCYHFLEQTWAPYLESLGIVVSLAMERPGFYPRGGGVVRAVIQPTPKISGFQGMITENLASLAVVSAVASLPSEIADRQLRKASWALGPYRELLQGTTETWEGGPGTYLGIRLDTKPAPTLFFALGARGKPAETVADEAVAQVHEFLRTQPLAVDVHTADQLVLPLALANGASSFSVSQVSLHLLTNLEVIRSFLDRDLGIEGREGEPGVIFVK